MDALITGPVNNPDILAEVQPERDTGYTSGTLSILFRVIYLAGRDGFPVLPSFV